MKGTKNFKCTSESRDLSNWNSVMSSCFERKKKNFESRSLSATLCTHPCDVWSTVDSRINGYPLLKIPLAEGSPCVRYLWTPQYSSFVRLFFRSFVRSFVRSVARSFVHSLIQNSTHINHCPIEAVDSDWRYPTFEKPFEFLFRVTLCLSNDHTDHKIKDNILKHSASPFRFLCLVHNSIALSRVSESRSRSSSLLLLSSSVWTPATAAASNRFRLPPGPAPPISQENRKTFLSVVKPRVWAQKATRNTPMRYTIACFQTVKD